MLLYAALTRYWPGPGMGTLPPAPLSDGRPCSPRQVCAGVPASIDEVATQALFQRDRRRGPPLTTPALLADALAEVIPAPLAPPPAAPAPPGPRTGGFARHRGLRAAVAVRAAAAVGLPGHPGAGRRPTAAAGVTRRRSAPGGPCSAGWPSCWSSCWSSRPSGPGCTA